MKFKRVGWVPITATGADMNLTVDHAPYVGAEEDKENYVIGRNSGFTRKTIASLNISTVGYKGMCTMRNWRDCIFIGGNSGTEAFDSYGNWPIYPWHRNGPLNNQTEGWAASDTENKVTPIKYSTLKNKKMSNLRYSYWTEYHPLTDDSQDLSIQDLKIFDSNEAINTRLSELNYYGNVDKILHINRTAEVSPSLVETNGYELFGITSTSTGDHYQDISHDTGGALWAGYKAFTADPISIKYKSSIHSVADIRPGNLQSLRTGTNTINSGYGYLLLVDLINPNNKNKVKFGGDTAEAIQNNLWLIGGESVPLDIENGNTVLKWSQGDTYVQRYDCLKTYPYTQEDPNSIVEILSFMCETRINIDGRYDRNRGLKSNLYVIPQNFNLLNKVYSQRNNFFNYRILNKDLFKSERYPNWITWSKTKTPGTETDTWTNVTLANALDLDGDKGEVIAIKRFMNNIFAFQERGISRIRFNDRTQISTQQGVPVELANSGKL
ncbi:MAG: hypothetical protein HUJ56_01370 [Erysipelotrichaceae bacterium]|nr:hypothetical protein [Erysipelotrichaceae bacterium]